MLVLSVLLVLLVVFGRSDSCELTDSTGELEFMTTAIVELAPVFIVSAIFTEQFFPFLPRLVGILALVEQKSSKC